MNADGFRKLWQVPGVAQVTGKDGALDQYVELTRKAIAKVLMRQHNNSYDLNQAKQRIADEETKIKDFRDQIKRLEVAVANLKAQEASSNQKIGDIKDLEVTHYTEEAVTLSDEMQELKKLETSLVRMEKVSTENRYLGRNGDGNAASLRNVHQLVTIGDIDELTLVECHACLVYAVVFGAETLESWARKWKNPPVLDEGDWKGRMGQKAGTILCNNAINKNHAREIMFHLYDLSPVETPPDKRRGRSLSRKRSLSRGRSLSRDPSQSHSRKKPRYSLKDKEMMQSLIQNFVEQFDAEDWEEDSERMV
jgi:hypothetical protein